MGKPEKSIEFQLDFRYEDEKRPALSAVEGTVEKGRCVVLCGGSGCGKSTLLRCVNRLIPQFYEGELRGFCRIAGEDCGGKSIGEVGRLAASVFQDPRSQFFTLNSSTEVAFGLENFGFSHEDMVQRADEAFRRFHLESLRDRNVFTLSSGQRQLVAILSAWAMDTDLFLLDEPTANLDFAAISRLTELLLELKAQGRTLLISEHRLSYLRELADEYWLMEEGTLVRRLSREDMAALSPEELSSLGLRATHMDKVCQSREPLPPPAGEIHRLEAENISFSYKKSSRAVLQGLSLSGETGEVVGLIGANGCGKTTFGKLGSGLYRPTGGQLRLDGRPLRPRELVKESIFIMQEAEFQFFTNSVLAELSYGLPRAGERQEEIGELLKSVGLWECRNQHPFSLSGGQMQRLVLLMAYLSPKGIAVLDEPTAGLDRRSLEACAELIGRMRERKLVFVITHDPELISMVCTRCVRLAEGRCAGEFDLSRPGAFEQVKACMTGAPASAPEPERKAPGKPPRLLDPRTKLLMVLVSMAVGIWTDIPLMLMTFAGILAAALWERRWVLILTGGGLMAFIFLLYGIWPCTALSFVINFFPRIFLIGTAAGLLLGEREAPRTLAALRRLRVPERVILIFSVAFRFFPVLNLDLGMMNQSMKTRGFFPTVGSRLRAVPQYAEILIVPMVFRVIRIAEALSASAETRGIALPGRRESYISIGFGPADGILLGLFILCAVIGFFL